MFRCLPLSTVTISIILLGDLSGCAAYRPCGSDACKSDAKITSEVQGLFDRHPPLNVPNILTVETTQGVVYLNGQVATDLQRAFAESVALQAPGVAMVVNDIAVTEK